jgi:hypothetical protein
VGKLGAPDDWWQLFEVPIKESALVTACYDSFMSPELAKELRNAGFPNIQDLQHRQGRQFLASDGRVSVYSVGELAPPENWFIWI